MAAAAFDIVAVASSAGGLNALTVLLGALPADFAAPLVIVQHLDPHHRSVLAQLLQKRSPLRVKQAAAGEVIAAGSAYVAPPDHHLLVNAEGVLALTRTELVHFVRPSADLLFESVAAAYRSRAIAVVLSGSGSDGAMGVRAIKETGGKVIAQDEQTSQYFGMPGAAARTGSADFVLPLDRIAPALQALLRGEAP
ncbi:MAG TPA: chemotaxis protein CheB [Burkholderiales bacterium]|nr:chemotaxis protein CheB [Burkholderiales bacterium]